jgi:hypothetical protein
MSRPARPWDLFNKNIQKVTKIEQQSRMAICKECPFFISITQQCTKCGCFMQAKTLLPDAECPVHKWAAIDVRDVSFNKET